MNKAKIVSYVHDQGGGMSWCSNCDTALDLTQLYESVPQYICPHCKCELEFGELTVNEGGSDFP